MKKITFLLPLLLSACISGSSSNFPLRENMPNEILQKLTAAAAAKTGETVTLEESGYSVPILPIVCGYRTIKKVTTPEGGLEFQAEDVDGIMYLLFYGDKERANFRETGVQKSYYSRDHAVLLGLFWHDWNDIDHFESKDSYELDRGWSIAWGLVKSYTKRKGRGAEETSFNLFWIPIVKNTSSPQPMK